MIIVMKPQAAESSITAIKEYIESSGLNAHLSRYRGYHHRRRRGQKPPVYRKSVALQDVDRIVPVTETYKLANRKFHPDPTTVKAGPASA